jgi:hypothetical protein
LRDGGTLDLQLDVMPRRSRAVAVVHRRSLGVTAVTAVISASMAEVDATHEGHVVASRAHAMNYQQLLVVRAEGPHPLIKQDLAAMAIDGLLQAAVGPLAEGEHFGVGAPDKAAYIHPPLGQGGQEVSDAGTTGCQQFVTVSPPIGEVDGVTCLQLRQLVDESLIVAATIDEWDHAVALGPGSAGICGFVELGVRIPTLGMGEKPS